MTSIQQLHVAFEKGCYIRKAAYKQGGAVRQHPEKGHGVAADRQRARCGSRQADGVVWQQAGRGCGVVADRQGARCGSRQAEGVVWQQAGRGCGVVADRQRVQA